jgi:predicted RNase H-like HicB family nuclease
MATYESTLCWECKNTNRHKCPWFNPVDPQPVPGWVAERQEKARIGETYLVKECPNFEPEPQRAVQHSFTPSSGVRGVTWDVVTGRWQVRISYEGKGYYLGKYDTLVEAITVRLDAEKALAHGEEPRYVTAVRTSACAGVYLDRNRYQARITRNGKCYYLGYFKTEEEAIAVRKAAAEALARGEEPRVSHRR